ncbi:MAG: YqiJ family protein [Actinomycetia bacterium]|nr:YqiJ family protein [Actinomycetes bacterium]
MAASFELPTLVFTILFALVAALWVLGIFGFFEVELDLEVDAGDGAFDGALNALGMAGVPTVVILTLVAAGGWFTSVVLQLTVLDGRSGPLLVLLAIVTLVVAWLVALMFAAALSRPLARLMRTATAPSGSALVGRVGVVRSGRVDDQFGYADVDWIDGGSSRVEVRPADRTDTFGPGDRALLVDWDVDTGIYLVSPPPADLDL